MEINVKAIFVYFKGEAGRRKNMAVLYNMNQTNQYSFTMCSSFL